jgi:hypothetical protein
VEVNTSRSYHNINTHQEVKEGILPSVELPGKLVGKGFEVSLPKRSCRKNDSILPKQRHQNVITGFVLVQSLHKIQSCVTIGGIYHCHLSRYFPLFSEGKRSNTREASLVTSRDQVARLAKPTAPYLGHLDVIG